MRPAAGTGGVKRPRLHREIFSGGYGPGIGVEVGVPPPTISVHAERNGFLRSFS